MRRSVAPGAQRDPGGAAFLDESEVLVGTSDPLATWAWRTLRHPFQTALVVWIGLTAVVDIGGGGALDLLGSRGGFEGLLDDPAGLVQDFVLFPLLAAYYLWAPPGLLRVVGSLRTEGIVRVGDEYKRWLVDSLRRPLFRYGPLAFAIVFGPLIYFTYEASPLHGGVWIADSRMALLKLPLWMANSYIAAALGGRMVLLILLLRRVFAGPIIIQPLHPDGCGGLRPIGAFTSKVTAFILFAAFAMALQEVHYLADRGLLSSATALPFHFIAAALVIVGGVAFLGPLWVPHQRMSAAKYEALAHISSRFHAQHSALMSLLERGNEARIDDALKELEATRTIHKLVADFPVWPFDSRIVGTALSGVVLPTLVVMVNLLLGQNWPRLR